MKTALISLLLSAILLTAFGCARGGNVDKGHDGDIGEESTDLHDDSDGILTDDEEDMLPDATNDVDDTDGIGGRFRRGIDDLNTMEPDDLIPDGRENDRGSLDPTPGIVPMR